VVNKKALLEKYDGGVEAFKNRFRFNKEIDREDTELLSFVSMDAAQFQILPELGYDRATNTATDYVLIYRYEGLIWPVDWVETDKVFIWHKDCKLSAYKRAMEIEAIPLDELDAYQKRTGRMPWDEDDIY
jgi:hypothetical protein